MIGVSSLAFPGGRALKAWRERFSRFRPTCFQVGYWFLHRVDVPVVIETAVPVDPFEAMLLEASGADAGDGDDLPKLAERLGLPRAVVATLFDTLVRRGLVEKNADQTFRRTSAGESVLRTGRDSKKSVERREWTLIERLDATGRRLRPPHVWPAKPTAHAPWLPDDGLFLDRHSLGRPVSESAQWKATFGFPADVASVVSVDAPDVADWQTVIVDRAERVAVVGFRDHSSEAGGRWLAFSVRPGDWAPLETEPFVDTAWEASAVLAEPAPVDADWRNTWLAYCKQALLPTALAETVDFAIGEESISVRIAADASGPLGTIRKQILAGEAWLVSGAGFFRQARPIVLATP